MYSVPQSEQLTIFLAALGVGFLLGIMYDFLRAVRLSVTNSKPAIVLFDLLYFSLFGTISFLFIIALNKGEIRAYIIAGELIGAFFYYISFGIVAIRLTDFFAKQLRRLYSFIFKIFLAPFRFIKRLLLRLYEKINILLKKSEKNSQKIRKKHLPKLQMYVYNLFGIFLAGSANSRKGGGKNGKKEKHKKA